MIREETLNRFKKWCQEQLGNHCSDKDAQMANNIMALLEQEPCEDAISRDAIRLKIAEMPKYTVGKKLASIRHLEDFLEKELEGSIEVTSGICIGFTMALECIGKFIKELPPVNPQPKTRWIPVTKRPMTEDEKSWYESCYDEAEILDCPLPEDGEDVLITVNGMTWVDTFIRDETDGCYFESYDIDEVKAWMPLPEPYKAESEVEE